MLHTCVQKFDVTRNLENFWELNMAGLAFARWERTMVAYYLERP